MATLGQRIKELRQKNNLTQKELAKILGQSIRSIQYIEKNERGMDYRDLIKIADYFNVSIDYLVGRTDNPKLPDSHQKQPQVPFDPEKKEQEKP